MGKERRCKNAREFFAQMPEEIFGLWLDERIENLGWPPVGDRWEGILRGRPLSYWKKLRWEKNEIPLGFGMFDLDSRNIIETLVAGVVEESNYITEVTKNSGTRIHSICNFFDKKGKLPGSIVVLEDCGKFIIADGCHRLAVLFFGQYFMKNLFKMPVNHSVWVGSV